MPPRPEKMAGPAPKKLVAQPQRKRWPPAALLYAIIPHHEDSDQPLP